MSVIVNITHEIGDLSEYTSTVTDGGDLSVESAAALVGTKGLQCVIDDTTAIYGAKTGLNNTSGKARARFYFNPKTLAMGSGEKLLLLVLANAAVNAAAMVWVIYASSAYKIYAQLITDVPTAISTANYTITDALHYIEIYLQRAATNVSSDGSLQLWIDGVDKETITDRDNYDKFAQLAQTSFGSVAAAGAGTSGTFFLDDLVVNDDGGEIGPATTPITITLTTASAIAGGIALTVTKGAVSKALNTAALTAGGQITDIQPGAISKTLSTAVVTASGPITDVIPGALSKLLATAALTASGQATSILAGAITRDLATAILTAAGQASDIQPGAISKTLATAALLAEGEIIDVSSGAMITLNTAALTASGQVSDIIVGAIIKTLTTAALNAVGQSADVQPGAISTALDTAALTANGQTITVSVPIGSVTITLDTAALISGGQTVDITPGGAIINLDTAALTALGIAISIATMLVAFGNDTYVLFRDKRVTVTYRDKRVSVVYQDNRQEAK